MTQRMWAGAVFGLALTWFVGIGGTPPHASACSLCANVQQTPTYRQEAARPTARLILAGAIQNPKLVGMTGTTELHIEATLRSDPFLGDRKVIVLPRYLPVTDPKN